VVDSRYVLFIIDKFANAGHIVDELTIHKDMPQPLRIEVEETANVKGSEESIEVYELVAPVEVSEK